MKLSTITASLLGLGISMNAQVIDLNSSGWHLIGITDRSMNGSNIKMVDSIKNIKSITLFCKTFFFSITPKF